MKTSIKRMQSTVLVLLLLGSLLTCGGSGAESAEKFFYAVETNGEIYGAYEVSLTREEENGVPVVLLKDQGRSQAKALGADINSRTWSEYRIDPETWRVLSFESEIDQQSIVLRIAFTVDGDSAVMSLQPGGGEKRVMLDPDIIIENPIYFPHLLRDFGGTGRDRVDYLVLDPLDREVQDVTYSLQGTEDIELAGKTFKALIFDSFNHEIGLKMRLWIDADTGYLIKLNSIHSVISLVAKSVEPKIRRADVDTQIFAKTDVAIADILALSHLKTQAVMEPVGNTITPESLNVPGQAFIGTVENNRIEGVFEVSHEKYGGRNPPPFPPEFHDDEELRPFLEPEDFIESDDPVLVEKARELTEGASDSWEAAKRLSQWVADFIGYDIPGGASARNTYDIREGECGAHSRLFAAFCRAVGIPARVVWGCMYTPNYGGSFGQHGWNEVYMGEAGWIPIDTTAREIDYADSGHIRLGVLSSAHISFNPMEMTILDYTAGDRKYEEIRESGDTEMYQSYLGRYRGPRGRTFTVLLRNGKMAVDIPGSTTYELRDPDEKGIWYLALSRDVSLTFPRDESGQVIHLVLRNKVRIPKKESPEEIAVDVPEEYRPYLGKYPIPLENREIAVLYRRGNLAINFPGGGIRELEGPNAGGEWFEWSEGDRYSFLKDESGEVRAMILEETVRCPRIH